MTLISLVTGTYNRQQSLARMIASFRACLLTGIEYEIIVVDGGSTDLTIEWCKLQPDVKLIEQGELLGAIAAFDAGAYAAGGDYVLLANDDITFEAGSVIPAIVHLESNPLCGAVAFADDRPAPGYGDGFKVQNITVRQGRKDISLPYAQVGLFRKWLGDICGWWGSRDPIMGWKGSTYGGDNFLSARIYEHGYTVDTIPECRIHDMVEADNLRQHNYAVEQTNPGAYYKRFPKPPTLSNEPSVENPQNERLRILYLPLYEPHHGRYKWGLREALARVGLVAELDYVNVPYNLAEIVRDFKPHLMLTQIHNAGVIPEDVIADCRNANPSMVLVNWNGDVYSEGLTSPEMLSYLRLFDMQLSVNDSAVSVLMKAGIRAAYWQIGYEPLDESKIPSAVAHDVVFLGNNYTPERTKLGHVLQNMAGVNVGLYGRGWRWSYGDTTYKFYEGAAIYRNAKIAIGDNQYPSERGFVSNRIFEALANGVFLLHQRIDGLEELTGLRDGEHYVSWTDERDLQKSITYWLNRKHDSDRQRIAANGQAFVRQYHSFDARVEELFNSILPMLESEAA